MTDSEESRLRREVDALVARLEAAWNAGDGPAFTAPFADDADFVNVLGMHARGRDAIGAGHEHIFRTVYAGSTVAYRVESTRMLRPEVALAHVHAGLDVPGGPLAGHHEARWSAVLTHDGGEWKIASFHNTFIRDPASQGR